VVNRGPVPAPEPFRPPSHANLLTHIRYEHLYPANITLRSCARDDLQEYDSDAIYMDCQRFHDPDQDTTFLLRVARFTAHPAHPLLKQTYNTITLYEPPFSFFGVHGLPSTPSPPHRSCFQDPDVRDHVGLNLRIQRKILEVNGSTSIDNPPPPPRGVGVGGGRKGGGVHGPDRAVVVVVHGLDRAVVVVVAAVRGAGCTGLTEQWWWWWWKWWEWLVVVTIPKASPACEMAWLHHGVAPQAVEAPRGFCYALVTPHIHARPLPPGLA